MPNTAPPQYPSFADAARVWLKIGLLSFGGPAGQIALMHRELVEERRWISETRFLHALNYCMLLPGPEAQQLATYVGWLLHGTRGGVVAGTLFILPGFIVILTLSAAYTLFQQTDWLPSLFFGLKAAVLAIVLQAVLRVAQRALKNTFMVTLALVAFIALFAFAIPFPMVILLAGVAGYLGTRARPDLFVPKQIATMGADTNQGTEPSALIDTNMPDTPTSWAAAGKTIVVWGSFWLAPLLALLLLMGPATIFAAIFVFFSQMAVVTFGGAYAVLAYVAQYAVENAAWLQPGEMLDGLAMAETTPGPLVLVLNFVGFLAAYRDSALLDPLIAGLLGATLTAWVTFVPCFLWIFLGAPHLERLRANVALSGALTAITAAIVGVILNLAIWFGMHVLFIDVVDHRFGPISVTWPNWLSLDLQAAALAALATFLLLKARLGVLQTLAICAAAGFALKLWI